ncbi:MAG: isochorismatase [Candidatus Rokuibacteriota bacterium]|nr:MAG: isochorismatase [Candidatus Rokubacteria bacterium]
MPGELPLPPHFDAQRVAEVWRVPYEERAREAEAWAREHGVGPAADDGFRVCLVLVDCQNTFCTPGFELVVGPDVVDDSRRLTEFVYRNLGRVTQVAPTLDTHQAGQIFHALFLVDKKGGHPDPYTLVSVEDVARGLWRATDPSLQRHLEYYTDALEAGGKYRLTIWPYHAMLGGIGHALVSALEEAIFFHAVARRARVHFEVKGSEPLTEHYSALRPEVGDEPGRSAFAEALRDFDAVVFAGQAKSHCVAWTIADLLEDFGELARKVYLLEDCTSPVVVPGVADYTEQADEAVHRFAEAGMHVVRSTEPMSSWPGFGSG